MKSMLVIFVLIVAIAVPQAWGQLRHITEPGPREARLASLNRAEREVEELLIDPDQEELLSLGRILRRLSLPSVYPVEERAEVFERVREDLIAIPGHAMAIDARIRALLAQLALEERPSFQSSLAHNLDRTAMWDMEALGLMASVEAVRVLAGFLDVTYGFVTEEGFHRSGDLSGWAIIALKKILREGPHDPPTGRGDAIREGWIAWRDDVEAGKRTFRFKGSEQRYNFEGPVVAEVSPRAEPARGARPLIGEGLAEDQEEDSMPKESSGRNLALVVAALILLVACAGWGWVRFRPRAA